MELTSQRDEPVRASKLTHDAPEAVAADGIEDFRQVHEGSVQVNLLLLALLLQLACGKHHVDGSTLLLEAALALWQQVIFKVFNETVQKNSRYDLPAMQRSDIPLWLSQACLLPFCL